MMTSTTDQMDAERQQAHRVVEALRYVVLATADADGRPWASPVYFAADGLTTFWWVSSPASTHSRNIAARADVALTVFDSTQAVGTGLGVYAPAIARRVDDADVSRQVQTYSDRSVTDGAGAWDHRRLADSGLALYRADVTELSLLPGRGIDRRTALQP
jgi:uncharacterized protein YhbP (UPF0306 family)